MHRFKALRQFHDRQTRTQPKTDHAINEVIIEQNHFIELLKLRINELGDERNQLIEAMKERINSVERVDNIEANLQKQNEILSLIAKKEDELKQLSIKKKTKPRKKTIEHPVEVKKEIKKWR